MTPSENINSATDSMPMDLIDLAVVVGQNRRLLFVGPVIASLIALAASYAIKPTFSAKTVFMPPQQQQNMAASALQSLGGLASLAGAAGVKTPGDQYVALMQSSRVSTRVINAFTLKDVYASATLDDARKILASNVRIELGKKDGLVSVEVSDSDPVRAAAIANRYVDELRRLAGELALTEAQQRRVFFEKQLQQAKAKLATAQMALQATGVNERTLRVEPKAAAEAYANLRAQVTAAEVRLQSMRHHLTDEAPELKMAMSNLAALRGQLVKVEAVDQSAANDAYINAYREYKYQEALFDLFSKQFEVAKLDESKEGALIQVVDQATPPEKPVKPRKSLVAVLGGGVAGVLLLLYVFIKQAVMRSQDDAAGREKMDRLRRAWR
jgi:uncharacterized protein involved in exopolysaccharide biosynthesis